ncbi:hypothetical protein [Nocardia abscessus]|uniref:hypothetical protein n=1 Tax=Nocardia abscessus TaxID=120957 RepID=UPI002454A822|nr:hypothetical protein [Nocardia abscessus]
MSGDEGTESLRQYKLDNYAPGLYGFYAVRDDLRKAHHVRLRAIASTSSDSRHIAGAATSDGGALDLSWIE